MTDRIATSPILAALLARGRVGPDRLPLEPPVIPQAPFPPPPAIPQQPPQGDALMRQLLGSVIGLRGRQWSH
jgi:hypothetical protein